MSIDNTTKWQRELKSFLGIKSGIILEGNTLDVFLFEMNKEKYFDNLDELLYAYGKEKNFEMIYYNPLCGFYCKDEKKILEPYLSGYICKKNTLQIINGAYMPIKSGDYADAKKKEIQLIENESCKKQESNDESLKQVIMSQIVLRAMLNKEPRYDDDGMKINRGDYPSKIFVLNFASRFESCNLDDMAKTEMFMNLYTAISDAAGICGKKNTIIFVVDKYNDMPTWIYLNNPYVKNFCIEKPDRKIRRTYLSFLPDANDSYAVLKQFDSKVSEEFIAETSGLLCTEINQVINLAVNENVKITEIRKAIKMYKYGLKESPWEELENDIVERLESNFSNRIKGQDIALNKVKKVIMRAVKGMSGLQHSNADNKPRGILFFAGPTGVGKTETAKTIAETIFGDEDACIRFDMSEYRQEQSDQKLFGAPPGYVGYDGGGQLTNAIKNHPFSVLLFDEIEKAHPSILDKFLQILEDGRMTDNQGNTVYFSECIIIFTSNIGTTKTVYDENGRPIYDQFGNQVKKASISITDPFQDDTEEFKQQTNNIIKEGVKNYFINIGRPEILNRLGENNIVVFDFIDRKAAEQICERQVSNILDFTEKKLGIKVDVNNIRDYLKIKAIAQRENGGRGIGNMIEEKFINPLSEFMCEYNGKLVKINCSVGDDKKIIFQGEA